MHELAVTAIASLAGSTSLLLFYKAVQTEWPANYVSIDTDFGVIVNRSFMRYFLFTLAPTYLISLFTSTLCNRSGGFGLACAAIVGSTHIIFNNGRHFYRVSRYRHDQAKYAQLLVDAFNMIVVAFAALAGAAGPGPFKDVVPAAADFFDSLWTTALVALVGVCLLYSTRNRTTVATLFRRSARETSRYKAQALRLAREYDVDPPIVLAILYAENLQRPSWVRRLERLKGRLWHEGSYGVMQLTSATPLTDTESIELAIKGRLAGVHVAITEYGSYDYDDAKRIFSEWNNNDEFVSLALQLYGALYSEYPPASSDQMRAQDPEENQIVDSEIAALAREAEAITRGQAVANLRMLARVLGDLEIALQIGVTTEIGKLTALVEAVEALPIYPTEADLKLAQEVSQRVRDRSGL